MVVGYFVSRFICVPITYLVEIIQNTASMNFKHHSRRMVFTFSLIWAVVAAVSSIPAANSSLVAELLAHIWSP